MNSQKKNVDDTLLHIVDMKNTLHILTIKWTEDMAKFGTPSI